MPDADRQLDWYPTLTLELHPSGETLVGDFDTGAPISLVSYEWLVEHKIITPQVTFAVAQVSGSRMYWAIGVQLQASLISILPTRRGSFRLNEIAFTATGLRRFWSKLTALPQSGTS